MKQTKALIDKHNAIKKPNKDIVEVVKKKLPPVKTDKLPTFKMKYMGMSDTQSDNFAEEVIPAGDQAMPDFEEEDLGAGD